jgi:hypothetical protein
MTERTIKKDELRTSLENLGIVSDDGINDIIEAAFPPIFKPKKGQVIWVSDSDNFTETFTDVQFRKFSHMDINGRYVCNSYSNKLIPWMYAKPQTPTQKGE